MSVTMVVGAQWGDEAKGKVVDLLSQDAEITARFNGGDNAGHTVINEYGTFKLRLTSQRLCQPQNHLHHWSGSGGQPGDVDQRSPDDQECWN